MMNTDAALRSAVGFAMKAGRLATGDFAADKAFKSGKAKLIVLDSEISDNAKTRWQNACRVRNIPIIQLPDMGSAIGKAERMVAAVTDGGFAEMILKKAVQENELE